MNHFAGPWAEIETEIKQIVTITRFIRIYTANARDDGFFGNRGTAPFFGETRVGKKREIFFRHTSVDFSRNARRMLQIKLDFKEMKIKCFAHAHGGGGLSSPLIVSRRRERPRSR